MATVDKNKIAAKIEQDQKLHDLNAVKKWLINARNTDLNEDFLFIDALVRKVDIEIDTLLKGGATHASKENN